MNRLASSALHKKHTHTRTDGRTDGQTDRGIRILVELIWSNNKVHTSDENIGKSLILKVLTND